MLAFEVTFEKIIGQKVLSLEFFIGMVCYFILALIVPVADSRACS